MGDVAVVTDTVTVKIRIARIDQSVQIGVGLAGVIDTIQVAVCSTCLVRVAVIVDTVTVEIGIAGIDGPVGV